MPARGWVPTLKDLPEQTYRSTPRTYATSGGD